MRRLACALALGALLYALWWIYCYVAGEAFSLRAAPRQMIFKTGLTAISLAAARLHGLSWRNMGLCYSRRGSVRLVWYVTAGATMSAAALSAVWLNVRHPLATEMSPLEIVAVVWMMSSVGEEVFVRGFVQSLFYRDEIAEQMRNIGVAASALFFAAMHLPLLWTGMSRAGVCIVLMCALVFGCVAAIARRETGSVIHPILLHVTGNVAAAATAGIAALLIR